MKKIAMLQPNYIPWKGVFDLINKVDVFVFYDDVQYTSKDWRNRNKIRAPKEDIWLTVPVLTKGLRHQLICDAKINNSQNWKKKHYKTIKANYLKAPFFNEYEWILEDLYINNSWDKISDLDIYATKVLAKVLGIEVEWYRSSDLNQSGDKDGEKIIKICKELDCDYFINGPASKDFMNETLFAEHKIALEYMTYDYPEYKQLVEPFNHYVTVLDLIFNCGPEAGKYIFR